MCSLRGAATYGYWYWRDDSVLQPHTYTQAQHRQDNRTTSCWAQRKKLKAASTHHSDGSIPNDWLTCVWNDHFVSPRHTWITPNCWDCGCLVVYCNVGVWILPSETEFTRMEHGTSLCVRSLLVSRMQRAGGLDRGWGKWAECVWVLSPCGVIVDRDGSRSGWGQWRGDTSSYHRTRGWQLFGLHRYCCCFPMILNVSLHTYITPGKCQVDPSWRNDFGLVSTLDQTSCTETGYRWTFLTLRGRLYFTYNQKAYVVYHTRFTNLVYISPLLRILIKGMTKFTWGSQLFTFFRTEIPPQLKSPWTE